MALPKNTGLIPCSVRTLAASDTISTAPSVSFSNDTYSTTQRLQAGSYVRMYAITVSSGDVGRQYTFETSLPSGGTSVDTYLRLFNASGTQLDFDDDGGDDLYSRLEWTPTTVGTYYLGVSSYANCEYNPNVAGSGGTGSTGDYRLTITRQDPTPEPPIPPANFRSTSQTENSITLAWNSQSGLTGYTLQYRVPGQIGETSDPFDLTSAMARVRIKTAK